MLAPVTKYSTNAKMLKAARERERENNFFFTYIISEDGLGKCLSAHFLVVCFNQPTQRITVHDVSVVEVGHEHHAEAGEDEGEQLPVVGPEGEGGGQKKQKVDGEEGSSNHTRPIMASLGGTHTLRGDTRGS